MSPAPSRKLELGTGAWSAVGPEDKVALEAEESGFDILTFRDSPNLAPDPFVRIALAAQSTTQIRLATGPTNPIVRDPAAAASAIAALQVESGGRAILGVGGGDSALREIGKDYPVPFAVLSQYIRDVRAYLRGETVDRNGFPSQLRWLPAGILPVPVDVSCTGPRTIAFAAGAADRVSFAVGAAPERITWALDTATAGLSSVCRPRAEVQFGAWILVVVTDDLASGCEAIRGTVAVFAHFMAMQHSRSPEPAIVARMGKRFLEGLRDSDPHEGHDRVRTIADLLDDEFIAWYALIGPPATVAAGLHRLAKLGLGHVYLVFGSSAPDSDLVSESRRRFVSEVIPALGRLEA